MSVNRRIPDAAPDGAEGRSLTQIGSSDLSEAPSFNARRITQLIGMLIPTKLDSGIHQYITKMAYFLRLPLLFAHLQPKHCFQSFEQIFCIHGQLPF